MNHPSRFTDPDPHEHFYARALATLAGPRKRTATMLRTINAVYWLAVISALTWLLVMALYRPIPITDRTQVLLTTEVRAGEPIKVLYTLRRLKVCAADVSWQETDGAGEVHRFGPNHVAAPGDAGHPVSFAYSWSTARTAAPGPSRLRIVLEFQCPDNPLEAFWPATEVLPEIDYETIPREGAATPP